MRGTARPRHLRVFAAQLVVIGVGGAAGLWIAGVMAFLALRFTSEGIGWTRPIMYTALIGLAANVVGCYVFMYGKLGFPAMGAVGTGVSNALAMWIMFLMMLGYVHRRRVYRPFAIFARFDWPQRATQAEILALGLPISGAVMSEGGLFVVAALMMGTLGATVVAAHQIAINFASLMFMVPLSLHSATTIHVGHALGRGLIAQGRFAGFVGIALCGAFMTASALSILLFGDHIAALYTQDPDVRPLAAVLLLMAAIFQISDGLQVGSAGAPAGFQGCARADADLPVRLLGCRLPDGLRPGRRAGTRPDVRLARSHRWPDGNGIPADPALCAYIGARAARGARMIRALPKGAPRATTSAARQFANRQIFTRRKAPRGIS
ncbi:MAG: hypothetical protein HC872_07180 [Gammaproteobacteria bacterium]|nr:hypothetical protein [Gammaproteobacteria bacterium]